jgi:hypothetical protein
MADVAVSITATSCVMFNATYSRAPSALRERPLGAAPAMGIEPEAEKLPPGARENILTSLLAPPPT